MIEILLNTIALEPNRWTAEKVAYFKLDQLLEPVAGSGFQNLELWQYHISREGKTSIRQFRSMADSLGLAFPIIGMYPKLHLQGDARKREMDEFRKIFDYAKMLNAKIAKIWLGVFGSNEISPDDKTRSLNFLSEMLELAQQYDLSITGENHENTLLDTVESCHKILQRFAASNLKICYQPYDFFNTNRLLIEYHLLAKHIIHIHFQGRKTGKFALLQHADLNYAAFLSTLAENNFEGYWCIEFVKDCVVKNPKDFDINLVLANALQDKLFLELFHNNP